MKRPGTDVPKPQPRSANAACTAPYRIGLTGNIATGKSAVGRMLVSLGAELIDADKVAHQVMLSSGRAYAGVVEAFGPDIVGSDGEIDRRTLGRIVFADPAALQRLETLVHPSVIAEVELRIARSEAPVVVVEAIKLLESGMADAYDAIWVTMCPEEIQLARLVETRKLSRDEALARIHAQSPQLEKIARADMVIDTHMTLAETRAQVESAWADLQPLRSQ